MTGFYRPVINDNGHFRYTPHFHFHFLSLELHQCYRLAFRFQGSDSSCRCVSCDAFYPQAAHNISTWNFTTLWEISVMFIIGLYLTGYCGRCGILVHTFEGLKFEESKKVVYIYIFIHQYGSAQKENTNIQTKSSIKKHINHTQCAFTEQYNIYKMYWPNFRIY